jgi:hypothetical protein
MGVREAQRRYQSVGTKRNSQSVHHPKLKKTAFRRAAQRVDRMEMPRFFSDFDNGKTRYVDTIGTELADVDMVSREAIGLLASVFSDAPPDKSSRIFIVSVRNEAGLMIFTTTLTLQSDWLRAALQ